jgi:hypothetical protein
MKRLALLLALSTLAAGPLAADDPPTIDHQPVPCTIPDKPMSVCASVADDAMVAKARVYFRPAGDKYFAYVDMAFGGLSWCATLPAPREGKLRTIEYYLQAIDDAYQAQRTSTFQMSVESEATCGFPPLEKDPEKAGAIRVYGTHPKQGRKLFGEFDATGVTFVPIGN